MSKVKLGAVDQIGYLVEDLDASMEHWSNFTGVTPWTVFKDIKMDGIYRGQASRVVMDVGMAYFNNTQIELIAVREGTVSPYHNAEGEALIGPHHMAWVVDDLDEALRETVTDRLKVVYTASNPASRVAYLASEDEPGLLIELLQGAGLREMFDAGIRQAQSQ